MLRLNDEKFNNDWEKRDKRLGCWLFKQCHDKRWEIEKSEETIC